MRSAPKARQHCRGQRVFPQRHEGQCTALSLQHGHQVGHAQAEAARLFRDDHTVQASLHGLAPGRLHERGIPHVMSAQRLVRTVVAKQGRGRVGKGALVFGQ